MEKENGIVTMAKTFVSHNNLLSNLGFDSETVVENISKGKSGLEKFDDASLLPEPFCASIISSEKVKNEFSKIGDASAFTKLEQMVSSTLNFYFRVQTLLRKNCYIRLCIHLFLLKWVT